MSRLDIDVLRLSSAISSLYKKKRASVGVPRGLSDEKKKVFFYFNMISDLINIF